MGFHDNRTDRYVRATMATEMLDAETERTLALAWRDGRDERALHRLIAAYARLSVSMAGRFRRYGLPREDLIQQGNLGLMRAAEKFDPENGARFSTYARWWIKASMQDYVMRNLSLVRTASNAAQKKLFFHLRKVQAVVEREASANPEAAASQGGLAERIAQELTVPRAEVDLMLGRMAGPDLSLNAPQGGEEDAREWIDALEDQTEPTEDRVLGAMEAQRRLQSLTAALDALPPRERLIVVQRHLSEDPRTLNDLGVEMGISKERVRQLEERALSRMRDHVRRSHGLPLSH